MLPAAALSGPGSPSVLSIQLFLLYSRHLRCPVVCDVLEGTDLLVHVTVSTNRKQLMKDQPLTIAKEF